MENMQVQKKGEFMRKNILISTAILLLAIWGDASGQTPLNKTIYKPLPQLPAVQSTSKSKPSQTNQFVLKNGGHRTMVLPENTRRQIEKVIKMVREARLASIGETLRQIVECQNEQISCLASHPSWVDQAYESGVNGSLIDDCVSDAGKDCGSVCPDGAHNGRVSYIPTMYNFYLPVLCENGKVKIGTDSCTPNTDFPIQFSLLPPNDTIAFCYQGGPVSVAFPNVHSGRGSSHACILGNNDVVVSGGSELSFGGDSGCVGTLPDGKNLCITEFAENNGMCEITVELQ